MQKPYRFLIERVSSYAEEGGAFMRRRRLRGRAYARVWRPDGTIEAADADSANGQALFEVASELLSAGEVVGKPEGEA